MLSKIKAGLFNIGIKMTREKGVSQRDDDPVAITQEKRQFSEFHGTSLFSLQDANNFVEAYHEGRFAEAVDEFRKRAEEIEDDDVARRKAAQRRVLFLSGLDGREKDIALWDGEKRGPMDTELDGLRGIWDKDPVDLEECIKEELPCKSCVHGMTSDESVTGYNCTLPSAQACPREYEPPKESIMIGSTEEEAAEMLPTNPGVPRDEDITCSNDVIAGNKEPIINRNLGGIAPDLMGDCSCCEKTAECRTLCDAALERSERFGVDVKQPKRTCESCLKQDDCDPEGKAGNAKFNNCTGWVKKRTVKMGNAEITIPEGDPELQNKVTGWFKSSLDDACDHDGIPCGFGCAAHVTHPCEECGRQWPCKNIKAGGWHGKDRFEKPEDSEPLSKEDAELRRVVTAGKYMTQEEREEELKRTQPLPRHGGGHQ